MKFEHRAVAFIDVLGFKSLVTNADLEPSVFKQIEALVNLLSTAVPILDSRVSSIIPDRLIPLHQYISDCIILSAPINDDDLKNYNGLEIIVMRAIQLSHFFLSSGYLIRGGISVGNVWHTKSNIVGPAYQEAYLLEANGDKPYIVLSTSAIRFWRGGSRMCLVDDKTVFVNGLHDFYIPNNTEHDGIDKAYQSYAEIVENAIQSNISQSAQEKWKWFKEFLASESKEGLQWAQVQQGK